MRWAKKPPKKKPRPWDNEGKRRIRRRFLWLPLCLNDEWRWLEFITVVEEYTEHKHYYGDHGNYDRSWSWDFVEEVIEEEKS